MHDIPLTPLDTSDLSTIDTSALRVTLYVDESSPRSPAVELNPPSNPTVQLPSSSPAVQLPQLSSPAVQLPPPSSPAVQLPPHSSPGRVGEELIRSCVTPRKVRGVQEALRREKNLYRCALKLVPILFTKAELANSNTDGSHKKGSLDSGRLNSLKTLIFTQFPVTSNEEKEKIWRGIKGKINNKCRSITYASARLF